MKLLSRWMWLSIISEVNTILHLNPNNEAAIAVKNIAGIELVNLGFPFNKTEKGYELKIGEDILVISDKTTPITDKSEAIELTKLRAAISSINNTINGISDKDDNASNNNEDNKQTFNADEIMDIDNAKDIDTPIKTLFSAVEVHKKQSEAESSFTDPLEPDCLILNKVPDKNPAKKQSNNVSSTGDVLDLVNPMPSEQNADTMSGYKESLEKNDFLFSYHNIAIHQPDSSIMIRYEVIISPLYIKDGDVEILAWINDGTRSETSISKNGRKSVLLQLGTIPIIATGRFEEGKFIGDISLTKVMKETGVTIDIETQTFAGKGHILISDEDISVRIVPISFDNSASGNAQFFYSIKESDKEPVVGDNIGSDRVQFDYKGKPHCMIARWKNDVLYSSVRPV